MTDSGLPSDATVAERRAEYERQQKDRDERVARIVRAFTKLPYSESEGGEDMAETLTAIFATPASFNATAEFTLDDLEAISLRIAELNQMVMQGGMVLDEAAIRREAAELQRAEAEAAAFRSTQYEQPQRPEPSTPATYADQARAAIEARKLKTVKAPESPL